MVLEIFRQNVWVDVINLMSYHTEKKSPKNYKENPGLISYKVGDLNILDCIFIL